MASQIDHQPTTTGHRKTDVDMIVISTIRSDVDAKEFGVKIPVTRRTKMKKDLLCFGKLTTESRTAFLQILDEEVE